ncbi:MAG: hypothetical protein D3919_12250 [Candidatus Electrothrix sp. AW5]|nr:hypothetical protein [Candidatus Electrothrix gigas]
MAAPAVLCFYLFCSFDLLAMQTQEDCRKMIKLGVPADRVIALGNLKYDMEYPSVQEATHPLSPLSFLTEKGNQLVWVCGSTHLGEEKIIFQQLPSFLQKRSSRRLHKSLKSLS